MGITHFFMWFKNNYGKHIQELKANQTVDNIEVVIDNFLVDLNGIFHASTQKIYQYGSHQPSNKRLLSRTPKGLKAQLMVFEDVCQTISTLVQIVQPKKRLVLCIDGVAPVAKQCQQRQRRFRSSKEQHELISFNSNCITPGTKFMDFLSKYIDWYIRKQVSNQTWKDLEIIFSNEKAPSEGEHKAAEFIRKHGSDHESYCFQGMDADLIMLALATHKEKFYILREDVYNPSNDYFCINVGGFREDLIEKLRWENETISYNPILAINDFVFICFMVGNDFLPHLPCIAIIDGGVEFLLDLYFDVCKTYGHLTREFNHRILFNKPSLAKFLENVGLFEKEIFEYKLSKKESWFPEEILSRCSSVVDEKWSVDIETYKKQYMLDKFPKIKEKDICHQYLEGLQWVLSYYTRGVASWEWSFKHYYAPPASLISRHVEDFKFVKYPKSIPFDPFLQLLCVLPPKSCDLLPDEIKTILTDDKFNFSKYCPEDFHIDLEGKNREWQGIVILPIIDLELIKKIYDNNVHYINDKDMKRNKLGKTMKYEFSESINRVFKSFYGEIPNCRVKTSMFNI